MIAAAAAKPMTVLRIVLTPLLLEKPQPSGGTQQFRSCCRVRRSASEAEGRVSCGGTFCSITEHGGSLPAWRPHSSTNFGVGVPPSKLLPFWLTNTQLFRVNGPSHPEDWM